MRNSPLPLTAAIDHTLLKPNTTRDQIAALCDEALEYHFDAVCLAQRHVEFAAKRLAGSGVAVATVVRFSNGDTFFSP